MEYMIVTKFAGATAGGGDFQIELNGDSTLCNYKVQVITAYETGSVGSYIGCPGSGGGLSINGTGGTALTAGTIFVTNLYFYLQRLEVGGLGYMSQARDIVYFRIYCILRYDLVGEYNKQYHDNAIFIQMEMELVQVHG